jgi:hypothetical protein
MARLLSAGVIAGAVLCGCAAAPPASVPAPPDPIAAPAPASAPAAEQPGKAVPAVHYRCDRDIEFTVRFGDDSALVASPKRGSELLLRDAGGVTPQQAVYSNPRLRAEFGMGAAGREAELQYLPESQVAHCRRD